MCGKTRGRITCMETAKTNGHCVVYCLIFVAKCGGRTARVNVFCSATRANHNCYEVEACFETHSGDKELRPKLYFTVFLFY